MSFTITYLRLKQQIDQSLALELLEPDPASGGWSLQHRFYGEHGWCREGAGDTSPWPQVAQVEIWSTLWSNSRRCSRKLPWGAYRSIKKWVLELWTISTSGQMTPLPVLLTWPWGASDTQICFQPRAKKANIIDPAYHRIFKSSDPNPSSPPENSPLWQSTKRTIRN